MKPYIVGLIRKRDELNNKISAYQQKCKHSSFTKKHGSNTGNYDPTADCYWTECECNDCGHWWRVDGSI